MSEKQLTVTNDGPEIVSTNYWRTPLPGRGLVFVSVNARAFRILVPLGFPLADLRETREVLISRGPWIEQRLSDAIEVLFEDGSQDPFTLHVGRGQIDRLPPREDSGRHDLVCSVWVRGSGDDVVKAANWSCGYRVVDRIPWGRPWETGN